MHTIVRKIPWFAAGIVLAAIPIVAIGCGGGTAQVTQNPNQNSAARGFNGLIGNASGLTFATGGIQIGPSAVTFGTGTAYQTVKAAAAAGNGVVVAATIPGQNTPIASHNFYMSRGFYYTYVAYGQVGSNTFGPNIIQLDDTVPTTQINSANVAVRVLNLSPDAGPVSLYNSQTNTPIAGLTNVQNPNVGETSSFTPAYEVLAEVQGQTLTFKVVNSGGQQLTTASTTLGTSTTFVAGNSYSIFLIGSVATGAAQPFDAIVVQDTPLPTIPQG